MTEVLRVAAAQYPLDFLENAQAYQDKISSWVEEAAQAGARLLVFPEYGAMELAALEGRDAALDIERSIDAVTEGFELQSRVHRELAHAHSVFIVAGSGPRRSPRSGKISNVAQIFAPSGAYDEYQKMIPTPWEREALGLAGGPADGLRVYDLGFAKVGLVICYDIEFPLIGRMLAEAGAEIILVPSNTETVQGYWRVRTGCMARALENQLYTVQSPTVGPAGWCAIADANVGAAGLFAPSDDGFPVGGIVSLGEMNKPGWVYADVQPGLLHRLRSSGQVQTFNHWSEQPGTVDLPAVEVRVLA